MRWVFALAVLGVLAPAGAAQADPMFDGILASWDTAAGALVAAPGEANASLTPTEQALFGLGQLAAGQATFGVSNVLQQAARALPH